jgi:exodeoxyribonuclease-3
VKVVSFNINSIRARVHQLKAVIERLDPDVICLQETKVSDRDFPLDQVGSLGYRIDFHGQKGHYGVATFSRIPVVDVVKGFSTDSDDSQRRALTTYYDIKGTRLGIFNGYFPQGENRDHPTKFPAKAKFYRDLNQMVEQLPCEEFIILGDFNISHQDSDIGIGEANRKRWLRTGKCSFLPEEREWLNQLMAKGYYDTFRKIYPEVTDRFSWFDYRSKGFEDEPKRGLRIDLILATKGLYERCIDAGIDYDIRAMDKPSDHCPVWSEFEL